MRIAVISDTRLPTLPEGGHGLGRSAHDISRGLASRGHSMVLYAGKGSRSVFMDEISVYASEALLAHSIGDAADQYDVILDTSHQHMISQINDLPVLNRIADLECRWLPPCAVVNSPFMQGKYPGSKLVNTGIDITLIPFHLYPERFPDPSLAFMSFPIQHKGVRFAVSFAENVGMHLEVINGVNGDEKWHRLSSATALLHPSTIDAAPRLPLEAAACGVPTLCLNKDGAGYHVKDSVTGFVCEDQEDMAFLLDSVDELDRVPMREWVAAEHGYEEMITGYELLLNRVAKGEEW